jgi:hypothetical protein
MNCFDCAALNRAVPAVAICLDCGAAVCHNHAHVTPRWLTYTATINRSVRVQPPTRSIRCTTCHSAHEAASATRSAA